MATWSQLQLHVQCVGLMQAAKRETEERVKREQQEAEKQAAAAKKVSLSTCHLHMVVDISLALRLSVISCTRSSCARLVSRSVVNRLEWLKRCWLLHKDSTAKARTKGQEKQPSRLWLLGPCIGSSPAPNRLRSYPRLQQLRATSRWLRSCCS